MTGLTNELELILAYLEELFPNPQGELNYSKDYELLIAVMLSAQSTDKRVNSITPLLFSRYPNLEQLSKANVKDIENIIRPVGMYKTKALNIIDIATKLLVVGAVPNDREFLESLKGVGRKTANVVMGILFDEPVIAVDTHIARVSKRLGLAEYDDDVLEIEKKLTALLHEHNLTKSHHQLLLFGRYYCKAVKPECQNCKLINVCKEKVRTLIK